MENGRWLLVVAVSMMTYNVYRSHFMLLPSLHCYTRGPFTNPGLYLSKLGQESWVVVEWHTGNVLTLLEYRILVICSSLHYLGRKGRNTIPKSPKFANCLAKFKAWSIKQIKAMLKKIFACHLRALQCALTNIEGTLFQNTLWSRKHHPIHVMHVGA